MSTSSGCYSTDEDSSEDDDFDMMVSTVTMMYMYQDIDCISCRASLLSGKEYVREIMCGNPIQCYESIRMKPHVLLNLCDKLKTMGLLHDSKEVSVKEGVAMSLRILSHGTRQRMVADRFQHSTGTVHTWFKKVLRALKAFAVTVVKPVNRGDVQPEIKRDSRVYPFFKDCIGAIDGTHATAWAPTSRQKSFRGRKATLFTQNVMVICSHDMMFTFVYTGWEGTTNDARVFYDAIMRHDNRFPMPTGDYYYVVDSGYLTIEGFLAPFRGESYHRSDWRSRPSVRGKKELFNFFHSSVRNVIERAFGVLKARFHILKDIPNYPLRRQILIPHAYCALHNFIIIEDKADNLFTTYGADYIEVPDEGLNVIQEGFTVNMTDSSAMLQLRDTIASQL